MIKQDVVRERVGKYDQGDVAGVPVCFLYGGIALKEADQRLYAQWSYNP